MTAPGGVIGRAIIEIIPDVRRFASELRRQLHAASRQLKTLQRDIRPAERLLRGLSRSATGIAPGIALATAAFTALGAQAVVGGVIALGAAAEELAGTLLLIPAGAVAAGAAMGTLKVGFDGVSKAMKQFTKNPEKFRELAGELATNAKATLLTLDKLRPRLLAFRNAVQNALFAGMDKILSQLAHSVLPIVQRNFVSLAKIFNSSAKDVASFVQKASTLRELKGISANIVSGFKALRSAVRPAAQAILDLVRVGSDFLPAIGTEIAAVATRFANFIHNARETGKLKQWIAGGLRVLAQLGQIVSNVAFGLHSLLMTARAAGSGLLDTIQGLTQKFRDFMSSARGQREIIAFLHEAQAATQILLPLIGALANAFIRHLLPTLVSVGQILGPSVLGLFNTLGAAFDRLRPGLEAFATGFGQFITAMTPVVPVIAEVASAFLTLLGALSTQLGPAIAGVVSAIAGVLIPILNTLTTIVEHLPTGFFTFVVAVSAAGFAISGIIGIIRSVMSFMTLFALGLEVATIAVTAMRTALQEVAFFLGGPWGVALAAAVIAVSLFGEQIGGALEAARNGFDNLIDTISGVPGGMDAVRAGMAQVGTSTNNAASAADAHAAALRREVEAIRGVTQAAIEQSNADLGLQRAEQEVARVTQENVGGLNKQKTAFDITTIAGQNKQQMLNNLASAELTVIGTSKNVRAATTAAAVAFVTAAVKMGITRNAAIDLAAKYGLIPRNVNTSVFLTHAEAVKANLEALKRAIDNVPRTITVSTYVRGANVTAASGGSGHIFLRAGGGDLGAGDLAVVGEQGPELVAFGRAAKVFSHRDSVAMTSTDDQLSRINRMTSRPAVGAARYAPTSGATAAAAAPSITVDVQPEVHVFIGGRSIDPDIERVVVNRERQTARAVRAANTNVHGRRR